MELMVLMAALLDRLRQVGVEGSVEQAVEMVLGALPRMEPTEIIIIIQPQLQLVMPVQPLLGVVQLLDQRVEVGVEVVGLAL